VGHAVIDQRIEQPTVHPEAVALLELRAAMGG
jgi:hypothetical protein